MTDDLIRFETEGAVAVITLDRPPVNALGGELVEAIDAAVDRAADDAIRAVVVTGAPHFAVGADIKQFKAAFDDGRSHELGNSLSAVVTHLEALPKPTIAAVRGFALGGGLELAMGCDVRFMADDAKVGQTEIKLGIIPGAGGTQRLTRLVGLPRAREMVFSGRIVEADEALEIGLADRYVPGEDLLDEAMSVAREWATWPTAAIGAAKRAIYGGVGLPLEEALALESEQFEQVFRTEDAREGVTAFVDKRDPDFQGR
jgi:enoyl-CoA hydratase/carnithine racemase